MRFLLSVLLALCLRGDSAQAKQNMQIILGVDNSLVFRGIVEANSVLSAERKLQKLVEKRGNKNYPIFLVIDSPGGSISDGDDFIQFSKSIRNLHTITIFSASMAAGIVESLPGNRLIAENGILMFHRATAGFQGQVETGEVESRLAIVKEVVRNMEIRNAARLKISLDIYKSLIKDELWLTAGQAVRLQAADGVVDIRCTNELINSMEDMLVDLGFFQFKLKFSNCPLMRSPILPQRKEDLVTILKYKKEINEYLRGKGNNELVL